MNDVQPANIVKLKGSDAHRDGKKQRRAASPQSQHQQCSRLDVESKVPGSSSRRSFMPDDSSEPRHWIHEMTFFPTAAIHMPTPDGEEHATSPDGATATATTSNPQDSTWRRPPFKRLRQHHTQGSSRDSRSAADLPAFSQIQMT